MMFLNRIRAFIRSSKKINTSVYVEADQSSSTENMTLELRKPVPQKKYLHIGNASIIQGRFVFEKESGEITIGNRSFIGGSTFICVNKIEVGDDVLISWGCTIMDTDAHSLDWNHRANDVMHWKKGLDENKIGEYKDWSHVTTAPIKIASKAWIGFNSIILKGVTIGEGAVVGAGSVVTGDVESYTVVGGNPARIIKRL